MKASHTPGPWTLFPVSGGYSIEWSGAYPVANINWMMAKRPEAEANARLISAAPELLVALEGLLDVASTKFDDMTNPALIQARSAIFKATLTDQSTPSVGEKNAKVAA